jgi:hypothetical protein
MFPLCLTSIEHLVLFCGLDCDLGVMLIMSCVEVVEMCGRTKERGEIWIATLIELLLVESSKGLMIIVM